MRLYCLMFVDFFTGLFKKIDTFNLDVFCFYPFYLVVFVR